jgi:excisionase family DNA binding protein
MFNIEIRFKVRGHDVPPERFMALFFRETLGETLNEVVTLPTSATAQPQPLAAPTPTTETRPGPERRVVSVPEAALLLGLRPSTIRAWIGRRRIPFVRLGRRVVIPMEAIDDLLLRGLVPVKELR